MNFDLNKEEYDFLKNYNVILLTLGGSHAYGTNNEKSDVDVRGIVQTPTNGKTIEKLDKHVMHLFRLYMMAIDILENEKIVTYRDKEHDFLMSIRNGLFGDKFEGVEEALEPYIQRFQYACENTNLPEKPDMKKIEEFMIECNKKSIGGKQ